MKRVLLVFLLLSCFLFFLIPPPYVTAWENWPWGTKDSFLGEDHEWPSSQTLDDVTACTGRSGVSKCFEYSGVTATPAMLAGCIIYWDSATMGGVTLPTISGNTATVVVKDIQGSGITVFTENNQSILEDGTWGTKIWVAPGNLGHQVALTSVSSGISDFWDVIGNIGTNWTLE